MGFRIQILEGPEKGKGFAFDRVEISIGRTAENDVVLADNSISRQHLSIRDKGRAYILQDLGSSNGTLLNGKPVREAVLKPGDKIQAGAAVILFEGPKVVPGKSGSRPARNAKSQNAAPLVRSAGLRVDREEKPEESQLGKAAEDREKGLGKVGKGKRRRGQKESVGQRFKTWYFGLRKSMRLILPVIFGLTLALMVAGIFKGGKQIVRKIVWHDEEVFRPGLWVSEKLPEYYGIGNVSVGCRYQATFQFRYVTGRASVAFQVGHMDKPNEVDILLNGIHVDYAPLLGDGFSDLLRLNLPRKHLLQNKVNTLQFINTINKANQAAREKWAVTPLEVKEQALPHPDKEKAKEAFVRAQINYEHRTIDPGNLYRAKKDFKKARDYLELLPEQERTEIYGEAIEMIEIIERELERRFRNLKFGAEKDRKYGRARLAQRKYFLIMKTFPDQEDSRFQEGRSLLEKLE